jgi:hypothetical protein
MPWARLDDKFWRNQKMQALSHAARGAWTNMVSYCADTPEPTGFLTHKEACERGTAALVSQLVAGSALETVNGGYLIHDFDKYLDRGSRDRCRAWRERKRNESVTSPAGHQSVTESSPRATGLAVTSTSGLLPVPEPGPVPDSDGAKAQTKRRLTFPSHGTFRGGDTTPLADNLPKVTR